jgi:hypothetical protein
VLDKPLFELRIGPAGVDGVVDIIVVLVHFTKEILSRVGLWRCGFYDVVVYEPFMLVGKS